MRYVYPAIFTPDEELTDYYIVEFPNFDVAVTQGKNFSEAYQMDEDILNLVLMTMENNGEKIPKPCSLKDINVDGDKIVGLLEADTDAYRKILVMNFRITIFGTVR
jgi:predicted RNase H-like HicB family nuclease